MENGVANGEVKRAYKGKVKSVHYCFSAIFGYGSTIKLSFAWFDAGAQEELEDKLLTLSSIIIL